MTVREILCKARKIISDRNRWCQGTLQMGNRYCALGALWSIQGRMTDESKAATSTLEEAAWKLHRLSVAGVNDRIGYDATLNMYDKALEIACEREDLEATKEEVQNG